MTKIASGITSQRFLRLSGLCSFVRGEMVRSARYVTFCYISLRLLHLGASVSVAGKAEPISQEVNM